MCDICGDVLEIIDSRDLRVNDKNGVRLSKKEIMSVILYSQLWQQQRQCMCCYADIKNFGRFNNVIQLIIAQSIRLVETLVHDSKNQPQDEDEVDVTSLDPGSKMSTSISNEDNEKSEYDESSKNWSLEEKDRLFQFVNRLFLLNFPLYLAFKHRIPTTFEELAKQDASVLNDYCELNDSEVPLLLLRNVCYFCDSNGFQAMARCFREADPQSLQPAIANSLAAICANLRMWLNPKAFARFIVPIRSYMINYLCQFSEKDLRTAVVRNMSELIWQVLKETARGDALVSTAPAEVSTLSFFNFDREGLDLAVKYFVCSTLTLRLSGLNQINSQVSVLSELIQNESILANDSVVNQLADWLIENKIIEEIFGPNLHVEIIKQSQVILNFLAMECRLTNQHIDAIWAATQLKHCGKQVLDVLLTIVKNFDLLTAHYLHSLMKELDISMHNEQTLLLASSLTKLVWLGALASSATTTAVATTSSMITHHPTLAFVPRGHGSQSQFFAAVTAQDIPDEMELVAGEILKHASKLNLNGRRRNNSSRSQSEEEEEEDEVIGHVDAEDDDEDDLEMGEIKSQQLHLHQQQQLQPQRHVGGNSSNTNISNIHINQALALQHKHDQQHQRHHHGQLIGHFSHHRHHSLVSTSLAKQHWINKKGKRNLKHGVQSEDRIMFSKHVANQDDDDEEDEDDDDDDDEEDDEDDDDDDDPENSESSNNAEDDEEDDDDDEEDDDDNDMTVSKKKSQRPAGKGLTEKMLHVSRKHLLQQQQQRKKKMDSR
ncbi:hypothetical protein HELRODRAFT_174957 [Helobdella robusta]|uniref:Uncharacterized protein n=1 Tax=Helobdella robusta TaxID=6412 RepID=T1F8N4_HELRO|nr:hypothetical protein HELRODRAFT_174957 [Helobdella robusta]ESO01400.1 hypothetical protein HELRODRAFT_174957 [Helobdella robusta]